MTLAIHTIKPKKGSTKKRKTVGRGNSSGHGTYSGRGLKGQNSRSGVTNLKRLGMKHQLLQIPKKRGFKSKKLKNQIVNILEINYHFKDGDLVSPASLRKINLVKETNLPIKILGEGQLKLKKLTFKGVKCSDQAGEQIKKMEGKIIL